MTDTFSSHSAGLDSPGENFLDIDTDKSDTVDLTNATRAIYINVAGNLKFTSVGGQTLTRPFGAGWHPIRAVRVFSTGTTATGLTGAY